MCHLTQTNHHLSVQGAFFQIECNKESLMDSEISSSWGYFIFIKMTTTLEWPKLTALNFICIQLAYIKIKGEKSIFSKHRIFRSVNYKKIFLLISQKRQKNDWWLIIIDHQWQQYFIPALSTTTEFILIIIWLAQSLPTRLTRGDI